MRKNMKLLFTMFMCVLVLAIAVPASADTARPCAMKGHPEKYYVTTYPVEGCSKYEKIQCTKCKKAVKRYLSSSHDYKKAGTLVKPTCTREGYQNHYCSKCGIYRYTDHVKKALGHKYVFAGVVKKTGKNKYQCTRCTSHFESYAN